MNNLIVLIDNSTSMEMITETGLSRLQTSKNTFAQWLEKQNIYDNIYIYSFNEDIKEIGILNRFDNGLDANRQAVKLIREITIDQFSRSTRLWDFLNHMLQTKIALEGDCVIYCMTDGEDNGSILRYENIINKVKTLKNVEIIIIDLSFSDWNIPKGSDEIIRVINDQEQFDNLIYGKDLIGMNKTSEEIMPLPEVSANLISLIDCNQTDFDIVKKGLQKTISYIEDLTELRYYPATTIIVDEYLLADETIDTHHTIIESLIKLLGFCGLIELDLHVFSFISNFGVDILRSNEYADYSRIIDDEHRRYFRHLCEYKSGSIVQLLTNNNNKVSLFNEVDIKTSDLSKALRDHAIFMDETAYVYKKLRESGDYETKFYRTKEISTFDLEFMFQYLTKSEAIILKKCLDQNNIIIPEISSVATVYNLALVIYKKLYPSICYGPIIKNIRTFGMYFPDSDFAKKEIDNLCHIYGMPEIFKIFSGGTVLLCLTRLKKYFNQFIEHSGLVYSFEEKAKLYEDIILSILIHEHTHAIIDIGLDKSGNAGHDYNFKSKKYDRVNEALAEWSELNYFRNNELMFDIIMGHINSRSKETWPYYWTLAIENCKTLSLAKEKFLSLTRCSRLDTERAYLLLTKF